MRSSNSKLIHDACELAQSSSDNDTNQVIRHGSPVFILGMNGSGTTLLADCLGRHSDFYSIPNETKVLPYYLRNVDRIGDMRSIEARRRLATKIGATKALWLANGKQNLVLGDDALREPGFAAVVDALFRHLSRHSGKPRWIEKSPQNLGSALQIAEAFPNAQFVHIIRDGRDCAQSLHRRWRFDPCVTIYRWRNLVCLGRRAGAQMGSHRYFEIRYESLTSDPRSTLSDVCRFLGVPFEEGMLVAQVSTANAEIAHAGTIVVNSQRWRKYFTPRVVGRMEDVAGEFLADLGYPVESRGTSIPSAWRWWYSKLRGRLTAAIARIRSDGLVSVPVLYRALRVSRLQDSVDRSR